MAYQQREGSPLFLPVGFESSQSTEVTVDYGEGRRYSHPFNQSKQTYYKRVHPDASGSLRTTRINTKALTNLPIKDVVRILARSAASMSDAIDLYTQYIAAIPKMRWHTETTADERRLQDFERRITIGSGSLQSIVNQFVFAMLVEGAFCGEVTGNYVEGIFQVNPVSPLELTFTQEDDPKRGIVDIIGQGRGENHVVLQDPRKPNPYFIYDPIQKNTTEPWGAIPFLPGIAAEIMASELMTKTEQWIDGQIMPKGFFSFDLSSMNNLGISPDQIVKWVKESVDALEKNLSIADPTQAVISRLPTLWTLVGQLGKTNLDGLEMLDTIISRNLVRAYKVPSFLYDVGSGSNLNSTRERSEMLLWLRRIRNYQMKINEGFTQWGNIELMLQGSRNKCQFMLDDTDLEGERLVAEKEQLEATANKTQAEADQVDIESGIISREEARLLRIQNNERYSELPEQAPEMPEPMPEADDSDPEPEPEE